MSSTEIRPLKHLQAFGKLYSDAWRQVDEFRQDRGTDLPNWPDWCFLPMAAFYAIVSRRVNVMRLSLDTIGDVARLSALGTWRVTQGIYRFDPDLAKALIASPLVGAIPVEMLMKLPEWCLYIETPDYHFNGKPLYGFFVHLEFDTNNSGTELRFLMDGDTGLTPYVLHVGKWTITEAMDRSTREASKQADSAAIDFNYEASRDVTESVAMEIRPLISLLMYLCSEDPEYKGGAKTNGRPAPIKTKKGWRLFPPDKPKTVIVGATIGTALRAAEANSGGVSGTSKRPHIRGGHWHGYWKGKRGEQTLSYRWLPPMAINIE